MANTNEKDFLDKDGLIFLWSQLKVKFEGKVDKETGKSLLSDTEIARLASVVNYDDSDIQQSLQTLQGKVTELENNEYDDTALKAFIAETYATLANTYSKSEVYTKTETYAKSETYTKSEVDAAIISKIGSVYTPKGSVDSYTNLPTSDVEVGWVYNCKDTGKNYVWMGVSTDFPDGWDDLAGIVDLSGYVQTSDLVALSNDDIAKILSE